MIDAKHSVSGTTAVPAGLGAERGLSPDPLTNGVWPWASDDVSKPPISSSVKQENRLSKFE